MPATAIFVCVLSLMAMLYSILTAYDPLSLGKIFNVGCDTG